ncbi:hypothetical protein HJG60_011286 [Phyllostomus discolor]|uniref:Uncharacterized protein n=1 Tax=Phyllostomus discolor TaxID=89673 RepID=A0A834A7D5_9CHIR|nr:hypothetical protein HJG60_011286 [Phyllostomus discolor]
MKVWKNYTPEDAIAAIEKGTKAIKPETVNPCQRKLCLRVVHDFTKFMVEPIKEFTEEIVDMIKKRWGIRSFLDMDLGEIQELTDTTAEELTEDNLMEMSASEPGQTVRKTQKKQSQKTNGH